MQLCFFLITDTLSHKFIISHKRDEPITRVVSKYRIQMQLSQPRHTTVLLLPRVAQSISGRAVVRVRTCQ